MILALQAETSSVIDQMLTFEPSDTERNINFAIINDSIALERIEYFNWTLTLITAIDDVHIEPHDRTNIEIIDDDGKKMI